MERDYLILTQDECVLGEPVEMVDDAIKAGVLVPCDGGDDCPLLPPNKGHAGAGFVHFAAGMSWVNYDALDA